VKDGVCPKCGSKDVRTNATLPREQRPDAYGANSIPGFTTLRGWLSAMAPLDNYVCAMCGYVESYIKNPADLRHVQQHWPPATPSGNPDAK
jgi:rubredoxin